MSDPTGIAAWLDQSTAPRQAQEGHERPHAARILDLMRRLGARQSPILPRFDEEASAHSLAALSIGTVVAQQLPARPEALLVAEIGAAVLAAPWLSDEFAQEAALERGLGVADRLLPVGPELGRDTGTWGAIAGAVAVASDRAPEEIAQIACAAASLALAPVVVSQADIGYSALRVGHAAASALIAVSLVDAGFVSDSQAIDELRSRLGVDHEPASDRDREAMARVALKAMAEAMR